MERKNKVLVKINGQEYPIMGQEPKEYLLRVGSFVDEKMEEVAINNKKLSISMVAVLTSINIADQLLKLQNEFSLLQKECIAPLNELNHIKAEYEQVGKSLQEKEEENLRLIQDMEALSTFKEGHIHQLEELRAQVIEKDEALTKAEEIINDLQNKLFENQIKLVQARKQLDEFIMETDKKKVR